MDEVPGEPDPGSAVEPEHGEGRGNSFFRGGERPAPQPVPGLEVGKAVGDFLLVGLIGRGGMGQVWEAEQISLRRRVAVKFMRPERVSERSLGLFGREARAGGRLSHPGIVTVHGHGLSDGLAWIAMEYVEGAWTLRDFLNETALLEEVADGYDRSIARLVKEVAEAMQAAHDAAVIHRDLKPQNILITTDDRPKVTDFGLAKITDETALSETGDFAGTYFYMSPEQVTGRRMGIDHRTDVFSLGVVLYELLALRRPFEGDTSHQVAEQIVTKDPPDLRSIRSRVPRDLSVIAGKALEKDRDRRYQTMGEMAADLGRFLAGERILARPPSRLDQLLRWTRRNPTRSVAAGIVAITFTVIAFLLVANVRTNRALTAKSIESEERRIAAEQRADEVLRLSALQRLEDLTDEAGLLWPAHPENVDEYHAWLRRADELVAELPLHEQKLAALRRAAASRPSDEQERWWINQLDKLVEGIRSFADEEQGLSSRGISREHGWGIRRRLDVALALQQGLATGGAHARAWESALPSIRATYPRLDLTPQIGLVPIGPDPASGLWEFAHLGTGAPAVRSAAGTLELEEETGLVFVLLPGGTFWMGAQSRDPQGRNHDPEAMPQEQPVHEVVLSPYFLSKYEMTQAQWLRLTGGNPSYYQDRDLGMTLLHPVEQVSWLDCMAWLPRVGLTLPSEAQWECAARGGTTTPWWTGADRDLLAAKHAANLADQAAARHGMDWASIEDWPELDDGYPVHAPVGTYAANGFGLHEVHGNLWEWCLDGYAAEFYRTSPRNDPVAPWQDATPRVRRGGGFYNTADAARSTTRTNNTPAVANGSLGVRPARAITR